MPNLYANRGDAYIKMGMYRDAIPEYSQAIERRLASQTISLSLKQFRGLYPEYDKVSDEVLYRKLNALFFPAMEYNNFTKMMERNGRYSISLLNDLYEKRGDAYLRAGDYYRGVLDFQRIFKGIPNFAEVTERWRSLGTSTDGEDFFLDAKTVEFSRDGNTRLWIKTVGRKETQVIAYEMDCKIKRMRMNSIVTRDPNGKVTNSSDYTTDWQQVIPDTIGEHMFNGACSNVP